MWNGSTTDRMPFVKYEYTCFIVDERGKQTVINSPVTVGQKVDKAFTIYSDRSIYVQKSGKEEVYVNGYRLHDGQKCQAMSGSFIWCGNPSRRYKVYMNCRQKQMRSEMWVRFGPMENSLSQDIYIRSFRGMTSEFREYEAYANADNMWCIISEVYPERYLTRLADGFVVTVKEELSPEESYDFLYRFTTKYNEYSYAVEQLKNCDYLYSKGELLGVNGTWYKCPSRASSNLIVFNEKSLDDALEEWRGEYNVDMAWFRNLDWTKADSLFRDVAYEVMQFHKRGMVFTGLDSNHIHVNENMDSAKLVYDMVSDIELMSGTATSASDVYRLGTIMCKALDHSYTGIISGCGVADRYWKNLSTKCPDYVVNTLQKAVIPDARYRIQNIEEFMCGMRWKMKEPKCKDFGWKKNECKESEREGLDFSYPRNTVYIPPAPDYGDSSAPDFFTGLMYGCPLAKAIPGEKYMRTTEVIDYDR